MSSSAYVNQCEYVVISLLFSKLYRSGQGDVEMEQSSEPAAAQLIIHSKRGTKETDDHRGCSPSQRKVKETAGTRGAGKKNQSGSSFQAQTGKKGCLRQVLAEQHARQV